MCVCTCAYSLSGSVEGCDVECTQLARILGSSVGPLGAVSSSSENPLVVSGLFPLGLTWGEPFGGAGL